MVSILVTDDDNNIRKLIETVFRKENFNVIVAVNGADALKKLDESKVDIVITDVMMPVMDGWKLCEEIRKFSSVPILMLTVQGEVSYKVKGFKLGIDDYLTKPFEPAELVARVQAILKRYNINTSKIINIGNLTIDRNSYSIQFGEKKTQIIPMKEFELLYLLCSMPGKTYTRENLIENVWGYDFEGNERTLDVHIGRLRERIKGEKINIKTIRGLGYRLEVEN